MKRRIIISGASNYNPYSISARLALTWTKDCSEGLEVKTERGEVLFGMEAREWLKRQPDAY